MGELIEILREAVQKYGRENTIGFRLFVVAPFLGALAILGSRIIY